MELLFINSIIYDDWNRVQSLFFVLAAFYICVLFAIFIDFASGIEKAKRQKEIITSFGYRRTIQKIKDYFSVLMLFTLADIVASVWFNLPFFTAIGTIAIVFIEAKSVYENKKDINKGIKDLPNVLLQILKNKDKAAELLKFLEDNNKVEPSKTIKNG